MPINIDAFANAAARAADANRVLTLSGDEVRDTGRVKTFFTARAAHRATLATFVGALRQRYGDHVADMLGNSHLVTGMREAGRPLTAWMARDLIALAEAEKTRVNAANAQTVERFLSGADPERNLDAALDRFCAKYGVPAENRALLRGKVEDFLSRKAARGGFHPAILTADALERNVAGGWKSFTANYDFRMAGEFLGKTGAAYPGGAADKLRLLEMGLSEGGSPAHLRALHELPRMRELQPGDGPLTEATVWRALFDEELPEAVTSGRVSLGEAASEKHGMERAALLRTSGRTESALLQAESHLPWRRVAELARRPDVIRLGEAGLRGIENAISHQGERNSALHCLRTDPQRVGVSRGGNAAGQTVPPPVYVFRHDNGEERIQVGRNTDFPGIADAREREAYLRGGDNALSRRLAEAAQEICGADASEAQVTNVMLCLGQCALLPVRHLAGLIGAPFNEHSHVEVTLSRQPDGAVRAELKSPEALRDSQGHFHMSIDVAPDGKMSVREFELRPNARELESRAGSRAIAEQARRRELMEAAAAPLLATGTEPDGLGEAVRRRVEARSPGVSLDPNVLAGGRDTFVGKFIYALSNLAGVPHWAPEGYEENLATMLASARAFAPVVRERGDGLLTVEELRQMRDGMVDAFFTRLETAAARIPETQRALFTRVCLEHMNVPDAALCAATVQLAGTSARTLGAIAAARDAGEVRQLLESLASVATAVRNAALISANESLPPEAKLGGDDALTLQSTALRMALYALAGEPGLENFARLLAREGGPLRDLLYDLAHAPEDDERARGLRQSFDVIRTELASRITPATMERLDAETIGERNLSLARQREILGAGAFVARGAHTEVDLNATLSRDMPAIREYVRNDAEKTIRERLPTTTVATPDPNDPAWSLHGAFVADIPRGGIFVDGHFLPPGRSAAENEAAFVGQFPDRRTAAALSTVANQTLPGILIGALTVAVGQQGVSQGPGEPRPTREGEVLTDAMWGDPGLYGGEGPQDVRIDSLGGNRYRVSFRTAKTAGDNGFVSRNGAERSLAEVSIDIDVGDDPPTVEGAQADILLRGRETVPGEPELPAAPPPSGRTALRPPAA